MDIYPENLSAGGAFLIGRGYSAGHRLLLIPGIAADPDRQNDLLQKVASAPDEIPQVIYSGDVAIVYVSHPVTTADLLTDNVRDTLDQPGRPLVMYYGFVVAAERVVAVNPDDLQQAWQQAIACYRAFLQDENGFATWTAKSFPIQSTIITASPSRPRRRLVALLTLPAGAAVALAAFAVALIPPKTTPHSFPPPTPPTETVRPAKSPGLVLAPAIEGKEAGYLSSVAMPGCPQEAGCLRWTVDPAESLDVICSLIVNAEVWYTVKRKDQLAYVPATWTVSSTAELPAIPQCAAPTASPTPTGA